MTRVFLRNTPYTPTPPQTLSIQNGEVLLISALFQTGCFDLSFYLCAHLSTYLHTLVSLFVNKLVDDDDNEVQIQTQVLQIGILYS